MAFTSITDDDLTGKGTVGMADTPNLTAPEMQAKFDELPNLVINKFKTHITEESANTAAANTGAVDPTTGGEATNVQGVLDNLQTKKQEKETGKGLSANDFTDTYRNELDTAFENAHTHTNKGVLDLITSAVKTAYDRLVSLFTNITSITTTVNGSDTALPTAGAISRYVQQMGGGDMVKSIYDTDNDGIVDHAEVADSLQNPIAATAVTYNHTASGLTAENAQAAIDEVHNEAKNSVQTSAIENDLLGTDATKVLAAPQGKTLNVKIGGVRPGVVTNFSVSTGNASVKIKFTEPNNTELNGATLCKVKGCKIVMKQGQDPTDENDGIVVLSTEDGTDRPLGYYSNTEGEVSGLTNDIAYHFKAFPYSYDDIYYRNDTNIIISIPKAYVLYGFCIDPTNSAPESSVTYEDMAVGMTPGKMNFTTGLYEEGSWTNQIFFLQNNHVYMVKSNGTLDYQLNDNDYTQKADGSGSSAVSDTGYDGNAMVRFDTVWMYQYTDTSGKFHCKICNIKLDNNYHAYAHQRADGSIMNYILLAAFKGSLTSSKIRSLKGQSLMNTQTGANEITYATNNGSLWYTRTHAQRNLINMLLILVGKSLSCETVFGQGHTDGGTDASSMLTTGTLSNKGRFFGTNTNAAVKVFHLENWWGDQWERIAGIVTNGSVHPCVKMEKPYNTAGTGYTDLGYALGGTAGGYISAATMNEYGGMVPKTAAGSSSTYYCDGLWFVASCYALVGGGCINGLLCGPFALVLSDAVSLSSWDIGAALSCEQPA